jgi:hypothetical protein
MNEPIKHVLFYSFKLCIAVYVCIFFALGIIGSSLNINILYFLSLCCIYGITIIFSYIMLCISRKKYLSNFNHNISATTTLFVGSIFIVDNMSVIIFYLLKIEAPMFEICIYTSIFMTLITIFLLIKVRILIKKNFQTLYFISTNYVFFNHRNYTSVLNNIPFAYHMITLSLFTFTAFFGLYSKSFYYTEGFAIGICLVIFGMIFNLYPIFIFALYLRIIVHPRVEKTFNRPLRSCLCDINQHKALVDELLGPEPTKCPIQYEEVFPEK